MRTVLLLTLALAAAPLAACSHDVAAPPRVADGDATALLQQRIWLDHEPKGWGDRFHLLAFDPEHTGVHQERTVWKGAFELFRYEVDRGQLVLRLPGSKKVVKTAFKLERTRRGDADVRLTLDRPAEGPTVYWGYRFDGGDADAWVDARFGALAP